MPTRKFGRTQRIAAFVPLMVLSAAWTAAIAGVGVTATSAEEREGEIPDGTSVPDQAIEAPASVSDTQDLGLGVKGNTQQIVDNSSTNGIPAAALAAYQRAESVINRADKSCNLTWQLVAAIGRVESNHGRVQGNALDDDGVAKPGVFGIALNGSNNTRAIQDTDAGQFDNDTVWDRAVGPMQFIPGTWSTVGVDADGDGQRDPQDIDDAALATAVYLCSGNDDLSTVAGQRAAVYRYNHSQSYVNLVLRIMQAYLDGDFTPVPNGTVSAGPLAPIPNYDPTPGPGGNNTGSRNPGGSSPVPGGGANNEGDGPSGDGPSDGPSDGPGGDGPSDGPGGDGPSDGPSDDGTGGGGGGLGDNVDNLGDTVEKTLTKLQAQTFCTADQLKLPNFREYASFQACMAAHGY